MLLENQIDLPGQPRATQPDHSRVGVTDGAKPFHILALSGGGFRGLYTATVLKHLEEQLGGPLAHRFDLICGTSAGGLLALGLAAEIPAEQLQAMFEQDGVRIFNRPTGMRRILGPLKRAKYSPDGLSVKGKRIFPRVVNQISPPGCG